jgi:hypothetical protein
MGGRQQPHPCRECELARTRTRTRTRILHSIGTWPAAISGETVVESTEIGHEQVLLAKVRPVAEARTRCGSAISPADAVSSGPKSQ